MNKISLYFGGLVMSTLLLLSCTKEEINTNQPENNEEAIINTSTINLDFSAESRATEPINFEENDVRLYVFKSTQVSKGIKVLGLAVWQDWGENEWSDYTIDQQKDITAPTQNLDLKVSDIPAISIGGTAERYRYKLVCLATPKGSNILPELGNSTKYEDALTSAFVDENTQILFRDVLTLDNIATGEKPTGDEYLDYASLGDRYNKDTYSLRLILSRKYGEVKVTIMQNAVSKIPRLKEANKVVYSLTEIPKLMYFNNNHTVEPPKEWTGATTTFDVLLNYSESDTHTVKKEFSINLSEKNAEEIRLQCYPTYNQFYDVENTPDNGVGLTLKFYKDNEFLQSISIPAKNKLYVYPNTVSSVTLGEEGFTFGNPIELDNDGWNGINNY